MQKRTFEDFLQDLCFSINSHVLDDDMPDYFDNWLSNLDGEDYIRYADLYGQEQFIRGMDHVIKQI